MVAPPRSPVPTTSTAVAGELTVPTARRHRVTDSSPPTGLSPTHRLTVTKVVVEEAALPLVGFSEPPPEPGSDDHRRLHRTPAVGAASGGRRKRCQGPEDSRFVEHFISPKMS
jgi:hypothetical protein